MKLVAQIRLLPSEEQATALLEMMREFNAMCNSAAQTAFDTKTFSRFPLHHKSYYGIRSASELPASTVQKCIAKAVDAYKTGGRESVRQFRETGSVIYDNRTLRYNTDSVRITTLEGRIVVRFVVDNRNARLLNSQSGQSDLIYRDGKFYLLATCDVPEEPAIKPKNVIGVDLGVKNIATLSTGKNFAANTILAVRHRHRKLRTKLQKKGTKSAKRLLKKRRRKEQNFARDVNHCISKEIVSIAKGTRSAIALEDLKGIRKRATVRKAQRPTLHSWAFYQLRTFITYKAKLSGIPVVAVNPKYTSQRCNKCGHTEKANRKSQECFVCKSCGHSDHADINGAKNIAFLARPLSVGQTRKAA